MSACAWSPSTGTSSTWSGSRSSCPCTSARTWAAEVSTSSGSMPATTGSGDGTGGKDAAARRRVAPLVVWFAVLGGAVAWAVHEVAGWLLTELPCVRGHQEVLGLGLRSVTAVTTVVPGLVALTALVLALLGGRSLRDAGDDRRTTRARFMLRLGAWLAALAVMMIVLGGIAVAALPPGAQGGLTREQVAGGLGQEALRPAAFTVATTAPATVPLH